MKKNMTDELTAAREEMPQVWVALKAVYVGEPRGQLIERSGDWRSNDHVRFRPRFIMLSN
jgi:hypothetical protein